MKTAWDNSQYNRLSFYLIIYTDENFILNILAIIVWKVVGRRCEGN